MSRMLNRGPNDENKLIVRIVIILFFIGVAAYAISKFDDFKTVLDFAKHADEMVK